MYSPLESLLYLIQGPTVATPDTICIARMHSIDTVEGFDSTVIGDPNHTHTFTGVSVEGNYAMEIISINAIGGNAIVQNLIGTYIVYVTFLRILAAF